VSVSKGKTHWFISSLQQQKAAGTDSVNAQSGVIKSGEGSIAEDATKAAQGDSGEAQAIFLLG
jgi:hypothetical protein